MTVKKLHFEAAAQYRMSQEDLEKGRYGEEIGRMQYAEILVKQALGAVKSGMSDAVISDLKVGKGSLDLTGISLAYFMTKPDSRYKPYWHLL